MRARSPTLDSPTPALDFLLQNEPLPTLAEISDVSRDDRRGASKRALDARKVWERYDKAFARYGLMPLRCDYRLWRLFFERECLAEQRATSWGNPFEVAVSALESDEPVVVWSALILTSGLITKDEWPEGTPVLTSSQKRELANIAKQRFPSTTGRKSPLSITKDGGSPIKELPEARAGCAAIEIAIRCAVQKFDYDATAGSALVFNDSKEHVEKLQELFVHLDPEWEPGEPLWCSQLTRRGTDKRHILVISQFEYITRIPGFCYRGREVARNGYLTGGASENGSKLLADGFALAMSAYQSARSLSETHRFNRNFAKKFDYNWLVNNENRNLIQACKAARDAGEYLWAAKLSHWLLWTLPPDLRLRKTAICDGEYKFDDVATRSTGSVREMGLAVPQWALPEKGRESTPKDGSIAAGEIPADDTSDVDLQPENGPKPPSPNSAEGMKNKDPYWTRLMQDWETDNDWLKLRMFSTGVGEPEALLKSILRRMKKSEDILPDILESAFALNLKYGHLNSAMELVAHGHKPSRRGVLDLAHSLKRVQQACWYGLDFDVQQNWRESLRAAWHHNRSESFSDNDLLAIHEVLSGRLSSMMVSKGDNAAMLLLEQMVDKLDDQQLGYRMSSNRILKLKAPGVFNAERLAQAAMTLDDSALGLPVFVSLVRMSENQWSLIASDGGSFQRPNKLPIEADVEFKKLSDCLKNAVFYVGEVENDDELDWPWPDGLRTLSKSILEVARKVKADVCWIVLAVDESLASVPWQVLLREVDRRIIVSEVPSLGWTGLMMQREASTRAQYKSGLDFRHGSEVDLEKLITMIDRDTDRLMAVLSSATCVVAHGRLSQGFPEIVINGQALTPADYYELCHRRLVIFHSCWSGAPHDGVLGDYGGLPTCAFGSGCRLLCAPVVEIPPWIAEKLHQHLVASSGPREFGLRYLQAVNEYPAVALYKVFGLANELLGESSRTP